PHDVWQLETKTLDPAGPLGNPDLWVTLNIYDQLTRIANDGKTIVPDLATSWTTSRNNTIYTFHLRKGVRFHNGQRLSASDVKFCLDRAREPGRRWAWTLQVVKKVEAPNSSTVRITLKHRWAPFLADISLFDTGVYPKSYLKRVGESYFASHPVGT